MTSAQRVAALVPLGFTPRHAAFLATVALNGGYCLRRQYAAFAGLRYGHNVRDFLDHLVAHHYARRFTYRRDRGHSFKDDDVVIRLRALQAAAASMSVRSRVGGSDVGTSGRRIREFLRRLTQETASSRS